MIGLAEMQLRDRCASRLVAMLGGTLAAPPPDRDPVEAAKAHLREAGWTYRTAAPELGVHWAHLAKVLTGRRTSRALLERIHQLSPRESETITP